MLLCFLPGFPFLLDPSRPLFLDTAVVLLSLERYLLFGHYHLCASFLSLSGDDRGQTEPGNKNTSFGAGLAYVMQCQIPVTEIPVV